MSDWRTDRQMDRQRDICIMKWNFYVYTHSFLDVLVQKSARWDFFGKLGKICWWYQFRDSIIWYLSHTLPIYKIQYILSRLNLNINRYSVITWIILGSNKAKDVHGIYILFDNKVEKFTHKFLLDFHNMMANLGGIIGYCKETYWILFLLISVATMGLKRLKNIQ